MFVSKDNMAGALILKLWTNIFLKCPWPICFLLGGACQKQTSFHLKLSSTSFKIALFVFLNCTRNMFMFLCEYLFLLELICFTVF